MADFSREPDKTNDPSYMGYSRGTDNASLQPLSQVPELNTKYVQPDYKANTSVGRLFEGLGEVGGAAVKATDAVIKKNINDDITKGVDSIRDSFGVAQAANTSSGLAQASGAAGNETDSRLIPAKPDQPASLQRLGTKIDGLWEAYQNGSLSNSAYYAKMERFVRQEKAQNPGYGDDIDDMVKSKLGVTPANALRASLQDDVTKLAAKVQGQNDKWTTWERQNADVIAHVYGGYEKYQQDMAEGKIARPEVEARVANFNSIQTENKAAVLNLSAINGTMDFKGKLATQVATQGLTDVFDGVINKMNASVGFDPEKYLSDINSGNRAAPGPDEKVKISQSMGQLRVQMGVALDKYLDQSATTISGKPTTVRALIGNEAATQLKNQTMARLDVYDKAIMGDGDHSVLAMDAQLAKGRQDFAARRAGEMMPQLDFVKAMSDRVGDNLMKDLYEKSPGFTDPTLTTLSKMTWAGIASGTYQLKDTLNTYKKAGVNNAQLNWDAVTTAQQYIQKPEKLKDPEVAENAVKFLFHPNNAGITKDVLSASGPKAELAFWSTMTNERTMARIGRMSSGDKLRTASWAEGEFPALFNEQINSATQTAQQFAKGNNLSLQYDKGSNQFYFQKTSTRLEAGAGYNTPPDLLPTAQSKLQGLNTAIAGMKNVWKMSGETDVTGKLYGLMSSTGVDPSNPIYKLLQDEVQTQEGNRVKAANAPRNQSRY